MFGLAVQALINGTPVAELGAHIKKLGFNQELRALLGAFDNFLTPNYGGAANRVAVNPPKMVSLLFGMDCQLTHVLPAAYFLLNRFPGDFESAVLSASNGGGQNVVRAAMTGALSGAAVGVSGIPPRFIDDLSGGQQYLKQAVAIADGTIA